MANIKSAIKRIDVTKRNTLQNKQYISKIKTFTKNYLLALEIFKNNPNQLTYNLIRRNLDLVFIHIDKAVKTKVIHLNNAARKKSNLNIKFNKLIKIILN